MIVKEVKEAAALLSSHRALAYPTETFYGLGCAALAPEALDALARWKPRDPAAKPYPMLIGAQDQLASLVPDAAVTSLVEALAAAFWPGPLTLVLPGLPGLDPRICSPDGGVAVRVSSHATARALALAIGQPLVSTSANPPGQPPPRTADDVARGFAPEQGQATDESLAILDGGICQGGAPSTILSLLGDVPQLLRPGAISREDLAACDALAPWRDALLDGDP